jgi:putative endonuclease
MDETESLARRPWWRRWFGNRSERAAARYLKRKGYRILGRNVASTQGELDLVVLDGECVVFVEVRSTGAEDVSRPASSVDTAKQRRLTGLAVSYLQRHRLLGTAARFDVVAMSWPPNQSGPAIVHYQNAFEAVGRLQMFH